ncbi:hypothetical protein BH11PSE8_BH11PSE8_32090 [soil metagenome]
MSPSRNDLLDHSLELLAPLGTVRSRRMFGGHGIYVDEIFIALIAFERLYLKADALTRSRFDSAGCQPFTYDREGKPTASLNYLTAPDEAMESPAAMQPWARLALEAALRARAAKPAAPRPARNAKARRASAKASAAKP